MRGPDLPPKQSRALEALLGAPTVRSAASMASVSEATLYRWLAEPTFAQAYRDARRKSFEQSTAALQSAAIEAVETLRQVMAGADTPASARVAAARAVLEHSHRAMELEDLSVRLKALEAA